MFLTRKQTDSQQAASAKPVGRLPFPSAPKCGLYSVVPPPGLAEGDADNHISVPPSIVALQRRVAERRQAVPPDKTDYFDVLSVSAARALPCSECALSVQLSSKTIAYSVHTTYDLSDLAETEATAVDAEPQCVFLFPFSECGPGTQSFQVLAGGQPLLGEIVRVRRRDGRLISSSHRKCFLAETSDMSDEDQANVDGSLCAPNTSSRASPAGRTSPSAPRSGMKLLYLYVVERSMLQFLISDLLRAGHKSVKIDVQWRNSITPPVDSQRQEPLHVPFSYYCVPRTPDRINCTAQFAEGTRILIVKSPNCRGPLSLQARVDGHMAEVQAACIRVDGRRETQALAAYRHPLDYLWMFEFYFGAPPKSREEISVWGLTVVILVAALIVWYVLTKDLEL